MQTLPEGQVIIYSDASFNGRSRMYGVDVNNTPIEVPNSEELSPVGNDAVSSVKVGRGVRLEMFSDNGFRGDKLTLFEGNYPHLLDWNDRVTSLRVVKINPARHPVAMFYVDNNIGDDDATCHGLSDGDYPDSMQLLKNDSYTAVVVPQGVEVTVFENGNFSGYSQTFERPGTYYLRQYNLNDKLSSIRIINQKYVLTQVKLSDGTIIETDLRETIEVKLATYNESASAVATPTLVFNTTRSASFTTTKEQSLSYGQTVTVGFKPSIEGISGIEYELAISTQQVFTSSESSTESKQQGFEINVPITVLPGKRVQGRLVATPVTKQFNVTYKYKRADQNGQVIAEGETVEETGKLILKYALDASVIIEDITDGIPVVLKEVPLPNGSAKTA